jgi:hypothetical protein
MKFHHVGIPTKNKIKDEVYIPPAKMYMSGSGLTSYGIEWVRYEDDSPMPALVKTVPHVAYEVDDLAVAIKGANVIVQPCNPKPGLWIAFIEADGAPVEFLQIDHNIA